MKVETSGQEAEEGDVIESIEDDGFDDDEPGYMGGIQTVSPGTDIYESRVKKLGDVLGRPYKVPDYQRPYTWKAKRANRLWQDLTNRYIRNEDSGTDELASFAEYLLGPVVFAKEEKTHHDIVDGQQRLVTLTLLFCAIRDAVNEFNKDRTSEDSELFNNFARNIDKVALNDDCGALIELNTYELNQAYKHIITGNPLKTLTENVRKDPDAARIIGNYRELLRNAKEFCGKLGLDASGVKLIKRLNKLYELTTDIKAKNVFVHITIDDDAWAPHVFESLNSKNDPLAQSALIKSYLLHKLGVGSDEADSFATKWYQITKKFQTSANVKSSMDGFLYESALSRRIYAKPAKEDFSKFYQSDIIRKHLYGYLKRACKTKNDVQTYIGHLDTDVDNIVYALRPDMLQQSHPANLKHALASVSLLNATYIRRPIVAACREWGMRDAETIALANWLHQYFFVEVRVSEHKIDNIKQISKSVVEEITGNNRLRAILDNQDIFDQEKIETYDQEFKKKFSKMFEKPIKRLDTAKYILVCIERYLKPNSEISIYADKIELEHIFPKNPDMEKDGWVNTDLSDDFLNRLGNLTILTPPYNKHVANKGFIHKKGSTYANDYCYAKSELKINIDYLMRYNDWNVNYLVDREKSLCDIANEVWRLRSCFDQARLSAQ